jgi:hypothetical protein
VISQHEDLFVPHDERTLRRVQRKLDEVDRQVRAWADAVAAALPKGLNLLEEEYDLLALYLAQQRRRNVELDARNPDASIRGRISRYVPFLDVDDEIDISNAAHRMASTRLEADIDRATDFFCRDHNLPGLVEPVIDWRVAIRYLAQRVHHIAAQIDIKRELATSPLRFELALTARDLGADVVEKRNAMLGLFAPTPASAN